MINTNNVKIDATALRSPSLSADQKLASLTGSTGPGDATTKTVNSSSEFVIGPYDVLCGRHKSAFDNVGNRRFRVTISLWLKRYINAQTRQEKSLVIESIVDLIKSTGGRFLRPRHCICSEKDNSSATIQRNETASESGHTCASCSGQGLWEELDYKSAKAKVGHCIRDMAHARDITVISSSCDGAEEAPRKKLKLSHEINQNDISGGSIHDTKRSLSIESGSLMSMLEHRRHCTEDVTEQHDTSSDPDLALLEQPPFSHHHPSEDEKNLSGFHPEPTIDEVSHFLSYIDFDES